MQQNTNNWFAAPRRAIGVGTYLILVIAFSIFLVFKFFPVKGIKNSPVNKETTINKNLNDSTILDSQSQQHKKGSETVKNSTSSPPLEKEPPTLILLYLIILIGAIGACIHGISSLAEYVGNQDFKDQWTIWYLLRPFVGALLAFVFYLFLRGGLFKVNNTTSDLYGVLAIAGLIGMFSKQALYKISDIVDVIFLSNKERFLKNKLTEVPKPQITEIKPNTIEVNAKNRKITLIGTKFINGAKVFAGNTELKTTFDSSSQISAELSPEQLNKDEKLEIKVINPDSGGTSSNFISIISKKKANTIMIQPGEIYTPEELDNKKDEIRNYYKNEITFEQAREFIYGGEDLRKIISKVEFEIIDPKKLLVNIKFNRIDGQSTIIKNLSFRQLTLESSNNYLDHPKRGWGNLKMQQRLEICQHELSRWSLIIKSKDFIPTELEFINNDNFDYIELINNCTTSEGFEIKIHSNGKKYHGSFFMPKHIYEVLCEEQAGSLARQGWNVNWKGDSGPDSDHGLLTINSYPDQEKNPTFGQIYWEVLSHARNLIKLDLSIYRKIRKPVYSGDVIINFGKIIYDRWSIALGSDNEYIKKPKIRKLISSASKNEYINPPETYGEVLDGKYQFRLPTFKPNGIYDVTEATNKNHYPQLARLVHFEIYELENDLHELKLYADNFDKDKKELSKIIIGNIDLDSIPLYPDILTIDRFCFAPRSTKMKYDHHWIPPSIEFKKGKKAPYAFLLSSEKNIFIQAESWGIERAILSKADDQTIIIDLMSYERIVPVWQGEIILENPTSVVP